MAETLVSGIAENLLGKIASLALDQVALTWGLRTDLMKLQELLTTIKAVLLGAEEKQAQDRELRNWLRMLKNCCYDAEDVLDEIEYEGLRQKVLTQYGSTKIKVRRFFSGSSLLAFSVKVGHELKKLRERLDEIADHKPKVDLSELVDFRQGGCRLREMTDPLLRTSNIIGREDDKERILECLLHKNVGETLSVIPIVGLGGVGKTTLAKMLYNEGSVDVHFDLKIWVFVSEIFEKKQIMVSMIKSLTGYDCSDLDPDQLQTLIRENLNSKRFLIVLDDVWSDDRGKWIGFLELLVGGAAGSVVVVTTRSSIVARTVGTGPSYLLECLSHEQCLSLFKKLAFGEGEVESHPHLMEIGDDIVKKCGGLPLAVKTMGTLLYSKLYEPYWKFIRDSEMWKWKREEDDILPPLKLIYDQLPSHLRLCLTICSIYPMGYGFNSSELNQIWMSNGLLQSSNERDTEDIGLQYIKELYSRSFLQDFEENDVMSFKMHDLVHDLALSVSSSDCFVVNYGIWKVPDGIRYLALYGEGSLDQECPGFLQKENNLRAIIFPIKLRRFFTESFINTLISGSRYLRMLDLSEFPWEVLPSSIGGLKHLRSLDLSGSKIKRLPDSIWKLYNLLFLHLGGCSELGELPKDVRNLIVLRALSITVKQKHLPDDGIGCLRSLRHLHIIKCYNLECLFEDIQHLSSLRFLFVSYCENLISLPPNLMHLNALVDLSIVSCDQFNWMEEDDIQDIKLRLRSLVLQELPRVMTLPQWLQKSSKTLQRLMVSHCVNFSSFPKWLQDFTSLEKIEIFQCPKLVSPPEGMHRLTALKELTIGACPILSERYIDGEDWHEIVHVPNININGHAYANTRASSTV